MESQRPAEGEPSKKASLPKVSPTRVTVTEAKDIVWPKTVHVQGSLLGDERVVIGAKVGGRIAALGEGVQGRPVDLGSEVRARDVLARLESDEFELRVQQAESQLEQVRARLGLEKGQEDSQLIPAKVPSVVQEQVLWDEAKANWERAEALNRQTAISGEELQQRKAEVDVAAARYESALRGVDESIALLGVRRAELALARQTLQDAEIRAPFDGVVEQRHVAPGAYVQVGQPVVTLVKVNPWRFRASVPERYAQQIRIGQIVKIRIEGEPEVLEGEIVRISPSVDVSNRALTVEATEKSPSANAAVSEPRGSKMLRGLFAEADILLDANATTLAVPKAAVREFAGVDKVWLVNQGEAMEQAVETGRSNAEFVEITGGLKAGDVVVIGVRPKQAGPVEIAGKQQTGGA